MKIVNVSWTKRPATLVEQGPEQSVIEWMDTHTIQAISNNQIEITESRQSYAEIDAQHAAPRAARASSGPTKMDKAIEIVGRYDDKTHRALIIGTIMMECGMSKAGASTYYYNAKKSLKK